MSGSAYVLLVLLIIIASLWLILILSYLYSRLRHYRVTVVLDLRQPDAVNLVLETSHVILRKDILVLAEIWFGNALTDHPAGQLDVTSGSLGIYLGQQATILVELSHLSLDDSAFQWVDRLHGLFA